PPPARLTPPPPARLTPPPFTAPTTPHTATAMVVGQPSTTISPNITTVILTPQLPAKAIFTPQLPAKTIERAARQILHGSTYRATCLQMGINLDKNGVYLGSTGKDYGRVQRAVRKFRKTKTTGTRQREAELLTERAMTAERLASESKRSKHQVKQERDQARCKVKLLTERVTAAERLASESKRVEQQAIKKRNSMDKKLEASKKLVSDLRVAREQCRNYPVVVRERDKVLQERAKVGGWVGGCVVVM
ncbi:MAG: hypothetical protein CMH49_04940, partial [Myxococcales bacterium]|nr:hypothetical protein [Myxococcales bacterium]